MPRSKKPQKRQLCIALSAEALAELELAGKWTGQKPVHIAANWIEAYAAIAANTRRAEGISADDVHRLAEERKVPAANPWAAPAAHLESADLERSPQPIASERR